MFTMTAALIIIIHSLGEIGLTRTQVTPASVAQLTETQCTPTGWRSQGSIPRSTGRYRLRISGAHASRL